MILTGDIRGAGWRRNVPGDSWRASMPLVEPQVDSKVKTRNAAQRGRRGCDDGDVDNDAQEEAEDGAQGRRPGANRRRPKYLGCAS